MLKTLSNILPLLAVTLAQAQSSPAEPTVQPASGATVVIFLVVFVVSIVGFIGYSVWIGRKNKQANKSE